jgi:hypothetical protein
MLMTQRPEFDEGHACDCVCAVPWCPFFPVRMMCACHRRRRSRGPRPGDGAPPLHAVRRRGAGRGEPVVTRVSRRPSCRSTVSVTRETRVTVRGVQDQTQEAPRSAWVTLTRVGVTTTRSYLRALRRGARLYALKPYAVRDPRRKGKRKGLAPKIVCYSGKRRLQTVTKPPNLVGGDPEGVSSRLRCICAWGGAPSPLAPRSRGHPLKKSTKSHRALCNRGRRTHLRVAALPAALRASICSFASCPLDAALSGAAAAAHC